MHSLRWNIKIEAGHKIRDLLRRHSGLFTMRALIQRVSRASVNLPDGTSRSIGRGFVILIGVAKGDSGEDAAWLADKTAALRIFSNDEGKFDHSLLDIKGQALVVSQFTLYADCRKGRRPDFSSAGSPGEAEKLYEEFAQGLRARGITVKTGEFGARMKVEIINDGPVTILLEKGDSPI